MRALGSLVEEELSISSSIHSSASLEHLCMSGPAPGVGDSVMTKHSPCSGPPLDTQEGITPGPTCLSRVLSLVRGVGQSASSTPWQSTSILTS